jgi:hypothetical protein
MTNTPTKVPRKGQWLYSISQNVCGWRLEKGGPGASHGLFLQSEKLEVDQRQSKNEKKSM